VTVDRVTVDRVTVDRVTVDRVTVDRVTGDVEELLMDPGERLASRRSMIDRGEAAWLALLADFDRDQLWELDGQQSCVDWLVWRTHRSRGTAFEKVRIAHELRHRPVVAEAFEAGALSYSATRAITRLDRPDPEVDAALVDLAASGTVRDLEQVVRHYQLCAEQDRPPDLARLERRGVRLRRGPEGLGTAEITLDETELDELEVALRAFMDHAAGQPDPAGPDPAGPDPAGPDPADLATPAGEKPVDDSPAGDSGAAVETVPAWQRRADAFVDMIRVAMAHLGDGQLAGADRYLVHVVTDGRTGRTERLDGTPVEAGDAARMACDASHVCHTVGRHGELLDLGRRTRDWSTAQRRAISVRDGGTCRFPGCDRGIVDIHHLRFWSLGGGTDIANGLLLCSRHHTLVHRGFAAAGDSDGTVTFRRPNGTVLGETRPRRRTWQVLA
jgi:hypothetical protein